MTSKKLISLEACQKLIDAYEDLEAAWLDGTVSHDEAEEAAQVFNANTYLLEIDGEGSDDKSVREQARGYWNHLWDAKSRSLHLLDAIHMIRTRKMAGDDGTQVRRFVLKESQTKEVSELHPVLR
jgi:hypothetical protein